MIFTRGLPAEYDAWRNAGNPGWGWDDIKPYFIKSEKALYKSNPSEHGQTGMHVLDLWLVFPCSNVDR